MPISDTIRRAMEFPMEHVVRRYADDEGLPLEVAYEHERELKRYLALCATHPGELYRMRGPIDNLWHTFIIFTEDYHRFCEEVAGTFIHHFPDRRGEVPAEVKREGYQRFLDAYEATYGEPAPPQIWPRGRAATKAADEDGCEGCGGCGCHCIAITNSEPSGATS